MTIIYSPHYKQTNKHKTTDIKKQFAVYETTTQTV